MPKSVSDNLTINKLRGFNVEKLTSRLNLETDGGRLTLIDRLVDHYDRVGWPASLEVSEASGPGDDEWDE